MADNHAGLETRRELQPLVYYRSPDGKLTEIDGNFREFAEVALKHVDGPPTLLEMLCVRNKNSPEPLRELIEEYLAGKITQTAVAEEILKILAT